MLNREYRTDTTLDIDELASKHNDDNLEPKMSNRQYVANMTQLLYDIDQISANWFGEQGPDSRDELLFSVVKNQIVQNTVHTLHVMNMN